MLWTYNCIDCHKDYEKDYDKKGGDGSTKLYCHGCWSYRNSMIADIEACDPAERPAFHQIKIKELQARNERLRNETPQP